MTREQIAEDVLAYFLRNPQAADNLEGVARWRLLSEAVHRSVEETRDALEWLVSRGILLKLIPAGREAVFCLNREKKTEAETLLSEMLHGGAERPTRDKPRSAVGRPKHQRSQD